MSLDMAYLCYNITEQTTGFRNSEQKIQIEDYKRKFENKEAYL